MLVDVAARLLLPDLQAQLESLCAQLRTFAGHRTVWLDARGRLWHAEPDELLEDLGHRYAGTFFRPSVDELTDAVMLACGARHEEHHVSVGERYELSAAAAG